MIKFYGYNKCDTCRKAKKVLEQKNLKFSDIDITEQPPTKTTLRAILKNGDYAIKDLFNKSGVLYREMKMKDKINVLKESELLDLLAKNGKLVKRPIVADGSNFTVGFKEEVFSKTWT